VPAFQPTSAKVSLTEKEENEVNDEDEQLIEGKQQSYKPFQL